MTMVHHRGVAATVGLSAAVVLAVLVAAMAAVVALAAVSPRLALSEGVFWVSAAAVVVVHLVGGVLAGRLAGPRLARAGLGRAGTRYAWAATAPAAIALVTNLRPVEGIPPILGTLVPVLAAATGVFLGVRRDRGGRRTGGVKKRVGTIA
jgi:hypothetical protein